MGAADFSTDAIVATSAREAFRLAQEEALHEEGHGGYTGTVAEKGSFRVVHRHAGESVRDCIERNEERFDDKFGPAGCVETDIQAGVRSWVFFGVASC